MFLFYKINLELDDLKKGLDYDNEHKVLEKKFHLGGKCF